MSNYIDRDKIPFRTIEVTGQCGNTIVTDFVEVAYKSDILAAPAADVRPVVPGKWELTDETPYIRKHYHPVACSNCHRAGMEKWNYCPNCGADMREES